MDDGEINTGCVPSTIWPNFENSSCRLLLLVAYDKSAAQYAQI